MSKRTGQDTRQLRAIGHHLKPLVMLGGKGLSEALLGEVNRALDDHELIKVRVSVEDRDQRDALIAELCEQTGAQLVQRIGHIALILRHAAKPKPKLSNLQRFKEA
jgi:RNA-binding protein